jgi:uncharacterized protein (UPF0548 family)
MFSFTRPSPSKILSMLEKARNLPGNYGVLFETQSGPDKLFVPKRYVKDHTRTQIGQGHNAFEAAKAAFRQWKQFDLGWVRVANPDAAIEPDEVIAVEARTLGLWSVNLSRILYVIDEPDRFGFAYGTTALHVERGEERFLIEFYPVSGAVEFDLLAISQPAHWMVRLAYPYARSRQHKFARESHQRMRQVAADSV